MSGQLIAMQVSMALKYMTDDEVLAQRMAVLLGSTHQDKLGYDKIQSLLTQDNGTKMHDDTRAAFLALSGKRLGV